MGEIVILATSANKLSNGDKTGAWVEEIAAPYYEFKEAGYKVTLASPKGGKIPVDDVSIQGDAKTPVTVKFLEDSEAQKAMDNSVKLSDVDQSSILALFGAGGHGAAVDFPHDQLVAKAVSNLYKQGKVVSAVCHGPTIFAKAVDDQGVPIVKGKKVTGFSDSEEKAVGKDTVEGVEAPENILRRLGGVFSKAPNDWGEHVEIDSSGSGPIVTGQNPVSSAAAAKGVIASLQRRT